MSAWEWAVNPTGKLIQVTGDALAGKVGDLVNPENPFANAADKQAQWNGEREVIYKDNQHLQGQFQGAYGNPSIDVEPFETYSHTDIWNNTKGPQAIVAQTAKDAAASWENIGTQFKTLADEFKKSTEQIVDAGWSGKAASAASAGIGQYVDQSQQLPVSANLVSNKLKELSTGLHETYELMPEPVDKPGVTDYLQGAGSAIATMGASLLPTAGMLKGDYERHQQAEDEARRIMTTIYSPVTHQTDSGIPVLPEAPPVVSGVPASGPGTGGDGWGGGGGGGSSTGGGGGTGFGGGGLPTGGSGIGTGTGSTTGTGTGATPDLSNALSGLTNPLDGLLGDGNTQAASAAVPTGLQTDGLGAGGASTSPAGVGGGGAGGGVGGAGSGPLSGASLGGAGLAGAGLAGAGTGGSSGAAGAPAAGRAGMPGMGGMGAGAGRGKGDEDKEHKSPDYLKDKEHLENFIGLEGGKKYVPPVIGG